MQETRSHQKSTDATIRNLEVQLAKLVAERPTKTFAVNTEMKPKEECKEERHREHDKSLSVLLSLTTSSSLATIWKVFPIYMSFMASLAKRRKCKEDVFYVTFMPP
ncbi:hypothetical protein HKD37_05G013585 [Glycine soja]